MNQHRLPSDIVGLNDAWNRMVGWFKKYQVLS